MGFLRNRVRAALVKSGAHREEIEKSEVCGCFYCCQTFMNSEIDKWVDDGMTAVCPYCDVSAVLGSASGYPVQEIIFLQAMHAFGSVRADVFETGVPTL
jgi:hypothetical protein